MLKLYVRFCSATLLVLYPEMVSPHQNQDFKWVSASYVGSIGGSSCGYVPSWDQLRHLGAHDHAMWAQFGG